jgi:organic radical activating enzyme
VATREPVALLAKWALSKAAPLVVITGGEPLLQLGAVAELAGALTDAGRRVEIETNGTIIPSSELTGAVTQFNVSPKLANSGVPLEKRIKAEALSSFAQSGKAVFKFVADVPGDLLEVDVLAEMLKPAPVWVMAEGITGEAVVRRMRELSQPVIDRGWNLTPRLHVLLWGNERGR